LASHRPPKERIRPASRRKRPAVLVAAVSARFSIELVAAEALTERLRTAGFVEAELFGAGGRAFDAEGPRLIALARR
jgi:hypothetical protein